MYQLAQDNNFYRNDRDNPGRNDINIELIGGRTDIDELYYTIVDVASDGVPEMFIADVDFSKPIQENPSGYGDVNYEIVDTLGYADGKSGQLFNKDMGYRSHFFIMDTNIIKNYGSGGWNHYGVDYYQLNEDSITPELDQFVLREGDNYYLGASNRDEKTLINSGTYDSLVNKYKYKRDLVWHPINDLDSLTAELTKYKEIEVYLNGEKLSFDQPPIMENNRVMVPIRAIFEALGYSVEWFQDTQIAVARKGQNTITVRINDPVISYNQGDYTCDVPPKILNGRILVSIRAIAECAGCSVEWQQDSKTVQINASDAEEDVVYTTETVDIQANTLEKWIKEIDQAEQNVRGISPIGINPDGSFRDFGNIVTDREVLEYKQITVKLPYKQGVGLEDEYITGTMKVPSKVQYTLHKHKTKNEMNASFIGAFIAGLVNQQLVWTQTCSCGYQNKLTWEIPLENFKSLTGEEIYITTETTRLIN